MTRKPVCHKHYYYHILENTKQGTTKWIIWFLYFLNRALIASEKELSKVLHKSRFWNHIKDFELNERQRKMINLLLDDFKGKLTSSKWAKICKCSQDTAGRDIRNLISKNILLKEASGGRSTSYVLEDLKS